MHPFWQAGVRVQPPLISQGERDREALRDYFAGQALMGLCAGGKPIAVNGVEVTHERAAYMLADAMLKARSSPSVDQETGK